MNITIHNNDTVQFAFFFEIDWKWDWKLPLSGDAFQHF